MDDDKHGLLGPALAKIGETVMNIIGGRPDGIYLYVEIAEGWVSPSLFQDEGNAVQYYKSVGDIGYLLIDAWCLEEPDKRWSVMEYTIDGGKFAAKFHFDDMSDPDEGSDTRRERYLRARYGDKPVFYPSLHGGTTLRPD